MEVSVLLWLLSTWNNFFRQKEYINIKRYQLHLTYAITQYPNSGMDAHSQKNEKKTKKKSRYGIPALAATIYHHQDNT
jgi:hypothetical protein